MIEDCRHVSGALERFLVASGEKVVRVPPKLMGQSRRGERSAGKSDPIDALAVARAALREGTETLPAAHLDEAALELKLLLDHREDIVKARSADQQRLRWHLHDLWPELELPAGCLDRPTWLDRLARKLARAEQGARVRVARELVVEIRRCARKAKELEGEIAALVSQRAPELLELKGCGTLIAALPRESASAIVSTAAAIGSSIAPCTGSPSARDVHPPAREFLERKQAEGKSRREALRCLKRHLARRVWKLLIDSESEISPTTVDTQRSTPASQFAAAT